MIRWWVIKIILSCSINGLKSTNSFSGRSEMLDDTYWIANFKMTSDNHAQTWPFMNASHDSGCGNQWVLCHLLSQLSQVENQGNTCRNISNNPYVVCWHAIYIFIHPKKHGGVDYTVCVVAKWKRKRIFCRDILLSHLVFFTCVILIGSYVSIQHLCKTLHWKRISQHFWT